MLDHVAASVPVPTIYNRLHDKGIDWAYYSGPLAVASLLAQPRARTCSTSARPTAPATSAGSRRIADQPDDPNGQFFKDAKAGKLPPVVYIDPFFGENDDHPPLHPIMAQALIAAVYTALAKSPQWKNMLLVITYDEHGGFFDHVPPPTTTTDDTHRRSSASTGFEQMGFRVPAMVIGPYVKQSYVSSVAVRPHLGAQAPAERVRARAAQPAHGRGERPHRLHRHGPPRMRGDPAQPIELPTIDLSPVLSSTMTRPECKGMAFRTKDPISEWADLKKAPPPTSTARPT